MDKRQTIYRWINNRLASLGLHLERLPAYEQERFFVSARHRERLAAELAATASGFLQSHPQIAGQVDPARVAELAAEFVPLYRTHPVRLTKGGNNFNSCFWLFVITRLVDPASIIESGSFRGQSAWIFRQAAPDARLMCFDIYTGRFELDDPAIELIELIEHDWSEYDFSGLDLSRHLCFFDDHVSQARRVRECFERGLTRLIFDDDVPAMHLPSDADPGPPTINMIHDDSIDDGELFAWSVAGKTYEYRYSRAEALEIRAMIASYARLPQLLEVTGFQRQSGLSLVTLNRRV